jgi:hypothetical protein
MPVSTMQSFLKKKNVDAIITKLCEQFKLDMPQ